MHQNWKGILSRQLQVASHIPPTFTCNGLVPSSPQNGMEGPGLKSRASSQHPAHSFVPCWVVQGGGCGQLRVITPPSCVTFLTSRLQGSVCHSPQGSTYPCLGQPSISAHLLLTSAFVQTVPLLGHLPFQLSDNLMHTFFQKSRIQSLVFLSSNMASPTPTHPTCQL